MSNWVHSWLSNHGFPQFLSLINVFSLSLVEFAIFGDGIPSHRNMLRKESRLAKWKINGSENVQPSRNPFVGWVGSDLKANLTNWDE